MTRKALGRGLNALLQEAESPVQSSSLEQIQVELFDPNPLQPRQSFTPSSLEELAASIRTSGVVQPVLARRNGARYQLIAGERRWRAASLAGIETIPAIVRDLTDAEALELALTENLLREDLNPIEVAKAYDQLQRQFSLTHDEIAKRLGISRSAVTNTLRLLDLEPDIQELVMEDKISAGHARALVAAGSPDVRRRLVRAVLERGLSVRELEAMLAAQSAEKPAKSGSEPAKRIDPNIRAAITEMERALGTKVKIVGTGKRGRIEIAYYSEQDLERIYSKLLHI